MASEKGIGSTFQFYIKTRRTTPPATELPQRADVQLLVREDALREACGVELPTLQNGTSTPTLQIKTSLRPATPPLNSPKSFHILVVEDNLVNQKVVSKRKQHQNLISPLDSQILVPCRLSLEQGQPAVLETTLKE